MMGGNTTSNTNSGANGTVGKPGISARTTPVRTRRMAGGILSRAAMTATAAITTSSTTRIWTIAIISAVIRDDGLYGWGQRGRPPARQSARPPQRQFAGNARPPTDLLGAVHPVKARRFAGYPLRY